MSAQYTLHIYEGITEEDYADFSCNSLGSAYFAPRPGAFSIESFKKIADTPKHIIGDVSWLKAMVFEDPNAFIPDPIMELDKIFPQTLVKEFTVITDEVITRVKEAYGYPNQTGYNVEELEPLIDFLVDHQGKQVFSVSW